MTVVSPARLTKRRAVLMVVVLCYAAVGISVGAVPSAVTSNGGGDTAVGIAMGCYAFTAIAARVAFGFVMNAVGYRATLIVAAALLAVGSAVSAAPEIAVIVTGRLVLGVGVGAMMAAATAWVVELPTSENRIARSIGAIGTVNYAVLALATPVGTFITKHVNASTALIIAALFPAASIALLLVMRAPQVPVAAQNSAHQSGSRWLLIRIATVPGIALLLSGFGYAALVSFGAQFATERGISHSASVVIVYGAAMVITRIALGPWTDRLSRKIPTIIAFCAEAVGMLIITASHNQLALFTGIAAVGISMALIYPMLGGQVAAAAGPRRGTAVSIYGAFINLGIGLGSIIIGVIVQSAGITVAYMTATALLLAGALVTALIPNRPNETS